MAVKLCKDCKWSKLTEGDNYTLRCMNPEVNSKDAWALANRHHNGSDPRSEREKKGWFSACGMKGKQFEIKSELFKMKVD